MLKENITGTKKCNFFKGFKNEIMNNDRDHYLN